MSYGSVELRAFGSEPGSTVPLVFKNFAHYDVIVIGERECFLGSRFCNSVQVDEKDWRRMCVNP